LIVDTATGANSFALVDQTKEKIMQGKLLNEDSTEHEMAAHAQGLGDHEKGQSVASSGGCEGNWIINRCYWCNHPGCVNPWWISAQCANCGKWFAVNRG
jgi:hypothetical protein